MLIYKSRRLHWEGILDQLTNLTTITPSMDENVFVLDSLYNALDQQPSSVHIHESLLTVWDMLGDEGNEALHSLPY